MPTSGYKMNEEDYTDSEKVLLNPKEIKLYMSIVGSLIWLSGIRLDILFTTLYLSWWTKSPNQHHLKMGIYCLKYLWNSRDIPLVIGGGNKDNITITAYSDSSLGTAKKGKSINAHLVKLNEAVGAVIAKTTTSTTTHLSSFESELDAATSAVKSIERTRNILNEIGIEINKIANLFSDNNAMIEFVKGNSIAKNVRHMQLRLWFLREKYSYNHINIQHMNGTDIPADKLTKVSSTEEFERFRNDILGLNILNNSTKINKDESKINKDEQINCNENNNTDEKDKHSGENNDNSR